MIEAKNLKDRLELLAVEGETAQIQFLVRDGMEVLDEDAGAVGPDPQKDPLDLRDLRRVREGHLRIPGGSEFVELVGSVV